MGSFFICNNSKIHRFIFVNPVFMRFLVPIFTLLLVSRGEAQEIHPCDSIPALNAQIIEVLQPNVGKKIGKGECWDLIRFALDKVGANWDGYEGFGTKINVSSSCLSPGDIIMFKNVLFKEYDGRGGTTTISMKNHYAIVVKIDGEILTLMHQNTGEFGRKVGVSTINLAALVKGKLTYFRPIA